MEHVDIPALLERITDEKLKRIDPMDTTYILGVHRLILTRRPSGMAMWRERVFASMMKNATSASGFFGLPPGRVVELGAQIEL
jgi:KUP system potassium uptake protein